MPASMPRIIGAYATSPCQQIWDEAAEAEFYDGILAIPGATGLELPFNGALHPHDEKFLLDRLPAAWRHVITCLPGTMQRLAGNPAFGLASDDPAGRDAAVALARQARDAVRRLNDRMGCEAVIAVQLHSAPSRAPAAARSSPAALAASLATLAGLSWDGAALALEHCDTLNPAFPPAKGFLTLDQELAAIGDLPVGVSVNWARSVLETRDPGTALEHITHLAGLGRLAGVVFSGCSDRPDQPFGAWQDNHMPHQAVAAHSLLTDAAIRACLAVGEPDFVGIKIGAQPPDMPVAERIHLNRALFAAVMAARIDFP